MNELEEHNKDQFVVHKSVPILIFKGGIAWFLLTLLVYITDQAPLLYKNILEKINPGYFEWMSIPSVQSFIHLALNVIFGWIILYVVLSWFYEYYIIQSDAIIVRKGIIFSNEDVYQMEDVKSIDIYEGFWGKIFKTGTLKVYAFRIHKDIRLSDISNPYQVAVKIHGMHPTPLGLNWPSEKRRNNHQNNNIISKKYNRHNSVDDQE